MFLLSIESLPTWRGTKSSMVKKGSIHVHTTTKSSIKKKDSIHVLTAASSLHVMFMSILCALSLHLQDLLDL